MKRILSLILTLLLVVTLITSCGGKPQESAAAKDFKTLGDVLNTAGVEELQSATVDGDKYVYVYKLNDVFYRAIATVSEEQSDAIWDLDMFADDYDAKFKELVSPIKIDRIENLSELEPSREELDQWIGKTGKDLFDAGWTNSGWSLTDMVFWMDYGFFQYDVVMEGDIADPDNFEEDDIGALIVKSITPNGQLGDATNLD